MPGGKHQPAGIVHAGEWVAPQELVRSPVTAPVIGWLEQVRASGATRQISIPGSYATGGMVTASGSAAFDYAQAPVSVSGQLTEKTVASLVAAVNRLMQWQPKVATELIKKDLDTLDQINRNRGIN